MMELVTEMSPMVGVTTACKALAVPRATYYRCRRSSPAPRPTKPRPPCHRALPPEDVQQVLDVLQSERFVDVAPPEVYATLLDEGMRLCSVRSMYRYLSWMDT